MVDDIIENHLLIGKSTNEVLNLLGETSYGGKSYPYMYQVDFGKKVGPYGLGGKWLFNLRIDFDSSTNKVISVICID